ncbi:hypothetical protein [Amycolatopsis sp. Poz14]|uniref:hypothetical protein n=1 Tax=Amycolatopsis sp. Poz14 TaxID=1447705 RepID=UPI001EE8A6BB|nr:hypothetical protein [Amycolatopsis sp. Poz14]MCG3755270.1 hypothetical protein [Amycolatopsis sp. Poz14]
MPLTEVPRRVADIGGLEKPEADRDRLVELPCSLAGLGPAELLADSNRLAELPASPARCPDPA